YVSRNTPAERSEVARNLSLSARSALNIRFPAKNEAAALRTVFCGFRFAPNLFLSGANTLSEKKESVRRTEVNSGDRNPYSKSFTIFA
ncbi:MAG: hypothetical protein IK047_04930, partial [Clostridia bacterium]|nr:hypothetical protein [Clostridia bacterium]